MSKTNKIILWLVVIIVVVGLIWLGYSEKEPVVEGGVIKIGGLLCLTGHCAEFGENSLKGIELAIKEVNSEGGVLGKKIEFVIEDSNEDNLKETISAYQSLKNKGIKYIIGPNWTPAGNTLAPIVSKDDVIITSPSLGVADFNEYADNMFNTWTHDEIATRFLAKFAIDKGYKKAGIFSSTQPWEQLQGRAFEDEFQKLGGETFKVEPLETVTDLKTDALKILDFDPDVLIFTNTNNMGTASKELTKLGYEKFRLGVLLDETRIKAAEGTLEGAVYSLFPEAEDWFLDLFEKEYNQKPGVSADTAYDTLKIYVEAMKIAGTDEIEKVKETLLNMKEYQGASGYLQFDGKGGVIREPALWIVENGIGVPYETQ
jgi:branched-chain amino acid transport system substrate-binding protein